MEVQPAQGSQPARTSARGVFQSYLPKSIVSDHVD